MKKELIRVHSLRPRHILDPGVRERAMSVVCEARRPSPMKNHPLTRRVPSGYGRDKLWTISKSLLATTTTTIAVYAPSCCGFFIILHRRSYGGRSRHFGRCRESTGLVDDGVAHDIILLYAIYYVITSGGLNDMEIQTCPT